MQKSYIFLFLMVFLTGCSAIPKLQKVASTIPCMGSIGTTESKVFKKAFHKIGEPQLDKKITVSIRSVSFNKASFLAYKNYQEHMGKKATLTYVDSLSPKPRYYELKITDNIGLKEQLNAPENKGLLQYVMNDRSHRLLTGISFVAHMGMEKQLQEAEHLYVSNVDGHLTLEARGPLGHSKIKMTSLQVFDFSTSGFCWENNQYGQPQVAVFVPNGDSCPSSTEKNADKLNDTRAYLKF